MAVGKLTQAITLDVLPPGFTFTVTDLIKQDYGDWYTCYMPPRRPPFTVTAGHDIISSVLSSTSISDSGLGPSAQLQFTVTGEINGQLYTKSGFLRFAATEWFWSSRPDYSLLLYQLDGSTAQVISRPVSNLLSPDPFSLGFAVVGNDLVMTVNLTDRVTTEILGGLLSGIFYIHTKLFSWAFGKLVPIDKIIGIK